MTRSPLAVLRVADLVQADAQTVQGLVHGLLVPPVRAHVATTGAGTLLTLERRVARPAVLHRGAALRDLNAAMVRARAEFGSVALGSSRSTPPCV